MKKIGFFLHNATYTALIICFSMIAVSLFFVCLYLFSPALADGYTDNWLRLHSAEVVDTVVASVCLSFLGGWLLERTYREEKK